MSRFAIDDIDLFATLPDDAQERLAATARRDRFKPGDVITEEGAVAAALFAIASGTAEVSIGGEVVAGLRAGDFFGEIGALPNDDVRWPRRSATVRATSRLELIVVPEHEVHALVADFPSFGELLRSAADARLAR